MARTAAVEKHTGTRQRLLEAAHALIWANSYAHVSVEDICREAGVQKGSFYHFFPTKIDLAAAALEEHWTEVKPELDAIFTHNKTAPAQLRALCAAIHQKQKDALAATGMVCGCPYATVGAELGSSSDHMRQLTKTMNARFCGYFEKLLKQAAAEKRIPARDLKQRALEMNIYVIGAMLQARLTNSLASVGKSLETALFRISGIESGKMPVRLVKKR